MTPPTQVQDDLPPPACIATNVGKDRPQHFMLSTKYGVELMECGAGTVLKLYTADQFRTALASSRAKDEALLRQAMDAIDGIHPWANYDSQRNRATAVRELLRARLQGDKPC